MKTPRLFALALAPFVFGACKDAAPPPAPPDVVVADVVQKDVPIYLEWVGTIDGNINAQIRARVNGYLQTRNYKEGNLVHEGDVLFQIDPRPYRAAYDQARGELGRASAALTKTRQDVNRYTPLAKQGAVSQQELDNATQANRAASAAVDSARAALDKAKLDLDWTQIKSPITGIAVIQIPARPSLAPVFEKYAQSEQTSRRFLDRVAAQLGGDFGGR